MGIRIETAHLGAVIPPDLDFPYSVAVTLECDSAEDMFCRGFTRYQHQDGYKGAHAEAMRDGWLERQTANGRLWLCPRCSGK